MLNPQKISQLDFGKSSSRGLADPEPQPQPETEEVSPQEMIDALYTIMMQRFDKLEKTIIELCKEMKSRS
jgi:hypothetical protein